MLTAKKGCFVEGHEGADVVEYRKKFLRKMVGLGFLNQNNVPWFFGDVISWATYTPLWSVLYSYYCTV